MGNKPNELALENLELKKQVDYLKSSLDSLMDTLAQDDQLQLPWIGNLGHWYWYVPDNIVEFNDAKIEAIGYKRSEIEGNVDYQFFTEKLHPDDYEGVMENMRQHMMGKSSAYEVSYRIKHKDGSWRWYYDRGTVTKRSDDGQPIMIAGIVFDISEQKAKEAQLQELVEKLEKMATIDDLTNVYNRRTVQEKLETELDRSHRYSRALSIIFIDLDGFKLVNDNYGHNIGDEVLKSVSKILRENLRANDIIGRWGGR